MLKKLGVPTKIVTKFIKCTREMASLKYFHLRALRSFSLSVCTSFIVVNVYLSPGERFFRAKPLVPLHVFSCKKWPLVGFKLLC